MTDFKELREALDAYEKWLADGAPVVDPDDTYPDDLYLAATRPAPIRSMLDRLEAAERDAERYRWLKQNSSHATVYLEINAEIQDDRTLDAAIDAMKEET